MNYEGLAKARAKIRGFVTFLIVIGFISTMLEIEKVATVWGSLSGHPQIVNLIFAAAIFGFFVWIVKD